jgi:hypothetical protein
MEPRAPCIQVVKLTPVNVAEVSELQERDMETESNSPGNPPWWGLDSKSLRMVRASHGTHTCNPSTQEAEAA